LKSDAKTERTRRWLNFAGRCRILQIFFASGEQMKSAFWSHLIDPLGQ